jgi:phospholipid/cholesterol/gamma-HCH transport system ATP-binding protein
MQQPRPILRFDDVTVEAHSRYESAIWDVRFELAAGDLLLLLVEEEHRRLPLADAAQGVVPPLQGVVSFLGEDWQAMSPDSAASHRGRIGRVFEDGGWVSDLAVEQNILLAQRHHTARPEAEIREEAAGLARMFGLPGLPRGRPAGVRRQDLAKAACIRAFVGKPVLILLESPTQAVYADIIAPLVNAVQSARRHGAAVLWTTSEPPVWNNPGLRPTARCKMFGSQMHLLPGDA